MRSAAARWLSGWGLVLGLVAIVATPRLAPADTLDSAFEGHASSTVVNTPGSYKVGEDYTMYLELASIPFQNAPWYSWDLTKEYTAVVTVPVTSFTPPFFPNGLRSVAFGMGSVQIYEDATPDADPSDTSTYTNGLLLLWGTITGMNGSGSGAPSTLVMNFDTDPTDVTDGIEFAGGPGIENVGCDSGVRIEIDDAATFDPSPPSGYDENYVASWGCSATAISIDAETWGRIKAVYR